MRRAGQGGLLVGLLLLGVAGCWAEPPDAGAPGKVTTSAAPAVAAPAAARAPKAAPSKAPRQPSLRLAPRYLDRSYQAPDRAAGSTRRTGPGTAGTLRIPALGVVAPVDAVGLDRGVMAIPDSPARVGWLRSSAAITDTIGASMLSAHVSDRRDAPGVLFRLRTVRPGTVLTWTSKSGRAHRFVVTGVRTYPRSRGVPARLFRVDGPHELHLVTCTDRRTTAGGGFHYASNLVVTAREVQ